MALSEALNQLAKKPPGYKAAVLLGVIAVVGLLYYQLFYSSMAEERDNLAARKASLVSTQTKLDKDLADQQRLSKQNEELQQSIRDNQVALPTEAELPSFFDHLQRKAGDAGVNIRNWTRKAEDDVDIYIRVPVEVEVQGTYQNIMRYFALLGPQPGGARLGGGVKDDNALRLDERIVSIENLSLGDAKVKDGEIVLTAKFTASTFRQQGVGGGAAGAAKGSAAGGAVGKAVRQREQAVEKAAGQTPGGGAAPAASTGGDKATQGVSRVKDPGANVN